MVLELVDVVVVAAVLAVVDVLDDVVLARVLEEVDDVVVATVLDVVDDDVVVLATMLDEVDDDVVEVLVGGMTVSAKAPFEPPHDPPYPSTTIRYRCPPVTTGASREP